MRIGTWNLEGRWSDAHHELLTTMDCDVLLLTEVSERLELPEYAGHLGVALMAQCRRWAGVFSRAPLVRLPDPHPASAMAVVDGVTYCSSILPWKGCGNTEVWGEGNHAAMTARAVETLLAHLPTTDLVWGGDFNHALADREWAGSKAGRASIAAALDTLGLTVPTTDLPGQIEAILSIDHIAVPREADVVGAERISALLEHGRLSDHDAYVVTVGALGDSGPPPQCR